jgi:hypothetical protein
VYDGGRPPALREEKAELYKSILDILTDEGVEFEVTFGFRRLPEYAGLCGLYLVLALPDPPDRRILGGIENAIAEANARLRGRPKEGGCNLSLD